jgi:dihydropteroate synthase
MTLVMGVLNVTPDSFFDGGRWHDTAAAVAHGRQMVDDGADIVDVGGESTRPNASPVDEKTELDRVVPVVRELAREVEGRARISVDTRKRAVAEAALDAGASIVNDVSACLWPVAAQGGAGWVVMHMRGQPSDMMRHADYVDVVAEVRTYLVHRAEQAASDGVTEIWVDPGIGFAKTTTQNLAVLARLDELVASGWPVAVGLSRKRFTGVLAAAGREDAPAPLEDRLEGSVAGAVWAMTCGVALVRTHDVKATVDAARLVGVK